MRRGLHGMSSDDDEIPLDLHVPDYRLSPTEPPADPQQRPETVTNSDWKECALSCLALLFFATYGLVCAVAGYRYHDCGGNVNRTDR